MTASHTQLPERKRKPKKQQRERKKRFFTLHPDGFEEEEAKSGFDR